MIRVTTNIHQAGEQMQSVIEAEPVVLLQDEQQIQFRYEETETQSTVMIHVRLASEAPVIHLQRKGEFVSEMNFAAQRVTTGEYRLSATQQILFDIETAEIKVGERWNSIEWHYQLQQQGESLGDFHVKIEFLTEN